ncbi:HAD-IA family hydrolase [Phytoactinopolyspora alkaliphila]|uniref:HAD-IA family hydrolase n=1 Tax=Phytoactinopolyspora alkaliphila TaxID=1783498 RepID=A0A6N9YPH8_9ACTN|nr:HAD-IA family hydrolase [Phytoactinopolyspora alkaliphila]NED96729.1 HAD-IA family hydrolase [Phytoactinopolyspora alkaliphila]
MILGAGTTRAVFFDSGGTLATPTHASWWPKPRFAELVTAAGLSTPADDDASRAALAAGTAYLAERWRVTTLEEEHGVYVGFYDVVLRRLYGVAPAELLRALADAAVYELDQEPYADTMLVLDGLAEAGVRLGVITNAGPSIELRHRDMGLRDYFEPFVISAVVGHEKPGARIYQIALEQASLAPSDVAFVDDVAENVRTALDLGMQAFLIDRTGHAAGDQPGGGHSLPTMTALDELLSMIIGDPAQPRVADFQ